jgi:uncharacterized membrane protein YedE/YeeE
MAFFEGFFAVLSAVAGLFAAIPMDGFLRVLGNIFGAIVVFTILCCIVVMIVMLKIMAKDAFRDLIPAIKRKWRFRNNPNHIDNIERNTRTYPPCAFGPHTPYTDDIDEDYVNRLRGGR